MKKQEVLEYFGGIKQTAKALGVSIQAVYKWESVPLGRQYQIQVMTGGRLQAGQKAVDA